MSKNSNRAGGNNEFPVFAGILLGMVMGLAIAGGIAWFVLKKNNVPVPTTKDIPQISKAAETTDKNTTGKPAVAGTASAGSDGKARFEFYKELTEKPDNSAKKAERRDLALLKQTPATPAKAAATSAYFLQEGAYTTMEDAEKVKARLALLGMVASIQPANIPDKGLWYRVRLGPYKNSTEMNEALASLKLNGLNAAPIKAQ